MSSMSIQHTQKWKFYRKLNTDMLTNCWNDNEIVINFALRQENKKLIHHTNTNNFANDLIWACLPWTFCFFNQRDLLEVL